MRGVSNTAVRRSTEAVYLIDTHPDIENFIDIRLETGDSNRRMPNLHHGVCLTDKFMNAVENLQPWDLICPKTGKVTKTIDAYDLFMDLLVIRKTEAGEPFLLFIDHVNNKAPIEYRRLGKRVSSSNICTEIVIYTDEFNTAVCCLGSLNLEYYDEYKDILPQIVADCTDYLDNILSRFLRETDGLDAELKRYRKDGGGTGELLRLLAFEKARNSIRNERNIGLGVMGWHSLLQRKNIPFESPMAVGLNKKIIKDIRHASEDHQARITKENPELICPTSKEAGTSKRNIYTLAVAPTMSISSLCGLPSQGIEPWIANIFVKKVPSGSITIKNKYLDRVITKYAKDVAFVGTTDSDVIDAWVQEQWASIVKHNGSVQHLTWMGEYTKDVYKTAFEIDQRALLTQMGDRAHETDGVDQACSNNLFLKAEISYEELYSLHVMAWKLGVKSLYYARSEPEAQANTASGERKVITLEDSACVACE